MVNQYDIIVIGGGFYGCVVATSLKEKGFNVILIERDKDLLLRASYANQARVHNGYHYPRSFITAWRSLINFPRFVLEFAQCVDKSFEKIYAIARYNSKVNAYQFKSFCQHIAAPISVAPVKIKRFFNEQLIEEVFIVKEFAFNAVKLREMLRIKLERLEIPMLFNTSVQQVRQLDEQHLQVHLDDNSCLNARYVLNCTYAQINVLLKNSATPLLPLKHQIAEIALVQVPDEMKKWGVTVMDGSFFSVMPFPAHDLHSFSHVRYTHHETWSDLGDGYRNPYDYLEELKPVSNFPYMLRDAQRYLPILSETQYIRSLFEIKTLSMNNEMDDGRPILVHANPEMPHFYNIMGGKIDNIFDILVHLEKIIR